MGLMLKFSFLFPCIVNTAEILKYKITTNYLRVLTIIKLPEHLRPFLGLKQKLTRGHVGSASFLVKF